MRLNQAEGVTLGKALESSVSDPYRYSMNPDPDPAFLVNSDPVLDPDSGLKEPFEIFLIQKV
jgi:hypothetical protein